MSVLQIIYLVLGTLLLADVLFMLFNLNFSFYVFEKEIEAQRLDTDPDKRVLLNEEIYNSNGLYRTILKTFFYWFWFIYGLFTFLWPCHVLLFIINFAHNVKIYEQKKITLIGFIIKLILFCSVYLGTIVGLLLLR